MAKSDGSSSGHDQAKQDSPVRRESFDESLLNRSATLHMILDVEQLNRDELFFEKLSQRRLGGSPRE